MTLDELYPTGLTAGRTGHVSWTNRLHTRLKSLVHAVDFGTDLHAAAQAALARGGGIVQLDARAYTLTQPLPIANNLQYIGQGTATRLLWNGNGALFANSTGAWVVQGFSVRNLQMERPGLPKTGTAVALHGVRRAVLQDVVAVGFATGFDLVTVGSGEGAFFSLYNHFERCLFSTDAVAIHIGFKCNETIVEAGSIHRCDTGILFTDSANHAHITDVSIESCGVGIDLAGGTCDHTKVRDCRFEANTIGVRVAATITNLHLIRPYHDANGEDVVNV